jgi:diguanylate cyclase (GGDEF)-like protein/PAS domain S-box-containing protein
LDFTFLGVAPLPALLLAFTLDYTQRSQRLSRRVVGMLALQPALSLLLLWTDPWHGLFFGGQRALTATRIFSGGPWFWFNVVYSYGLILGSLILLIQSLLRTPRFYRGQATVVLFGVLAPVLVNVLMFLGLSPFPELDLTPFAFTITGLLFAYGLLGYRLFDLVPVARDRLVEYMHDGLVVLDAQDRVVDLNATAAQLTGGGPATPLIGRPVTEVFARWRELLARFHDATEVRAEVAIQDETLRHLDLTITPLYDRRNRLQGRLIVWRDITARKKAEAELQRANQRLQNQLGEIQRLEAQLREQAIRDPLTGLFNRRYLEETLARELSRAQRENQPLSVILLDIDHFKKLNDTFGHLAGDLVLRRLGELLRARTRHEDIACRYGGEEFLLILVNAPSEIAVKRAEQLRTEFDELSIRREGQLLRATLSLGIAAYPQHGDTAESLLLAADKALYAAKSAGRNCVMMSA